MRVVAHVDPPVEAAGGDQTEVEGGGAEGAELPPSPRRPLAGSPLMPIDGAVERRPARRRQSPLADPGAAAAHRLEPLARRLVGDEGDRRAVVVDDAQRRGEPGDAPAGVRRAVERIDDDEAVAVARAAALLGQHREPGVEQHGDGDVIDVDVDGVLAVTTPENPQSVDRCQPPRHLVGDAVEHVEGGIVEGGGAHRSAPDRHVDGRAELRRRHTAVGAEHRLRGVRRRQEAMQPAGGRRPPIAVQQC